jgi:Tfp pilus assembly protein PilN
MRLPVILELNLLSGEHKTSHDVFDIIDLIKDRRVVWPSFLLLISLLMAFMFWTSLDNQESELLDQEAVLNAELEREKPVILQINQIKTNLEEVRKKNLALKSIQVSKQRWISVFELLSSQMPPNMWIKSIQQGNRDAADTNISNDKSKELILQASTHQFDEVAQYMENLIASPTIDSVSLKSVQTQKMSDSLSLYNLELIAYISPYIGIDPRDTAALVRK